MNIRRINKFLQAIAANNNREWFQEHKAEYEACKADFEQSVDQLILAIAKFDPSISYLTAKDCTYRFYRDTRFSEDKSPYKTHFGAYVSAKGKKSLHAGYYLHIAPDGCMLASGAYWLPTNILTSCRNEILGNTEAWLKCVENGAFVKTFGYANEGDMEVKSGKGFGMTRLKTAPKGFPRDSELVPYLRMKDYVCWQYVPATLFEKENWIAESVKVFKVAKPMMDFMNSVIDDYE